MNQIPRKLDKKNLSDFENIENKLDEQGMNKRNLFPYQLRDLSCMLQSPNSANFSVPGAGKLLLHYV